MHQISETELTNRINTFMARKTKRLTELEADQLRFLPKDLSRSMTRTPTFLEKMNEFWVHQIHA